MEIMKNCSQYQINNGDIILICIFKNCMERSHYKVRYEMDDDRDFKEA